MLWNIETILICMEKAKDRNSHPEVFCAIAVLKSFAKLTRKHLCLSFFLNEFTRRPKTKRVRKKFFPAIFEKYFRAAFFLEVWSDITSKIFKYTEMFSSINLMKTDIYQIFLGSHCHVTFTGSKSTILEKGVKYVQSYR